MPSQDRVTDAVAQLAPPPVLLHFSTMPECTGACAGESRDSRGFTCVVCGLLVWCVNVPLIYLTLSVVTLLASLWSAPWWLWMIVRGKVPTHWTITRDNADLLEQECIDQLYPLGSRSEWLDLKPREGTAGVFAVSQWLAHRLRIPYQGRAAKPQTLIVIHGSGSAATLIMSSCGNALSKHFDLHCLDLPGFGRTTPPVGMTRQDVEDLSATQIVEMYSEFIERYCLTSGITQVECMYMYLHTHMCLCAYRYACIRSQIYTYRSVNVFS